MVWQGSLAQGDITQCHPDPAAACWPTKTQQLSTKNEISKSQATIAGSSWKHGEFWGQSTITLFPLWHWVGLHLEIGVEETPQLYLYTHVTSQQTPEIKHQWVRLYGASPNSVSWSMHWASQLFCLTSVRLELCCVELLFSTRNISLKAVSTMATATALCIFWCDKLYLERESVALWAERQTKQQAIKSRASSQRF